MLIMSDVSKVYPGGSVALQDVNVHIEPGEFVFVVGPSGAGKSTFIKMLFREVLPTTGSIFVNGVDILALSPKEIPFMRRQLGIIFQDYRLLPDRTVFENVAFAMQVIEAPHRKIRRQVNNVLDLVGLRHRSNAYHNEQREPPVFDEHSHNNAYNICGRPKQVNEAPCHHFGKPAYVAYHSCHKVADGCFVIE